MMNFAKILAAALLLSAAGGVTYDISGVELKSLKKAFARPNKVPYLDTNPYSKDKEELGKLVFFDPRLSKSGTVSCATCHNPAFAWGDGLPKAVGSNHKILGRKTPTILNLAWYEKLMWDGRFDHLEGQVLGPITSADEMSMQMDGDDGVITRLKAVPEYVTRFEKVFPGQGITNETIAKAVAVFERGVVSGKAPFDRWVAGDEKAISNEAKAGFVLFNKKANCVACHSGWNFSDGSFHDIGINSTDIGRGKQLKLGSMQFAFKTPGLRNIAMRDPYMHNGSEKRLEDVVEFYNRGGDVKRESLSDSIKPLGLSPEEKKQLVEFLKTLSSNDKKIDIPVLPR